MAHATRGIAATFVASTLALTACGQTGENARGGGPAKNQGNMTEAPYAPANGPVDTPSRDALNDPATNAPGPHENAVNAPANVGNDM